MMRFILSTIGVIISFYSCESNSKDREDKSLNENVDTISLADQNNFDNLNKVEIFYHGAVDVGEKLELYPDNTFYISHWNTFGTPSHKYGTYTQMNDQLILTDTFGYYFDFSSNSSDSILLDNLTTDTLYFWPTDERSYLSPYSEKTNNEFDQFLFWRKEKEIKIVVKNPALLLKQSLRPTLFAHPISPSTCSKSARHPT